MRGGIVLCALVSSVEAARRGRLSHGKVRMAKLLFLYSGCTRFAPSGGTSVFLMAISHSLGSAGACGRALL